VSRTRSESQVAEHFSDRKTQTHAAQLGMWIFLATEVLLFGALFAVYAFYAIEYSTDFHQAAKHNTLWRGSANTLVLLTSSFCMAMAVWAMRGARRGLCALLVGATILCGVVFLAIKAWEYQIHFSEGIYPGRLYHFEKLMTRGGVIFYTLYYFMTVLHALHMAIGCLLLSWVLWRVLRHRMDEHAHTPLELSGMYWHFVDIIWLFLWPLFYLVR
jgi:cytochrome c oxidase subunit 3